MKIILTGASGLIGSRFEELLFETHSIIPLTSKELDITNFEKVEAWFSDKDADVVVHLAGKTDVDGCEVDKTQDISFLNVSKEPHELDLKNLDPDVWMGKNTAFAINTFGTYSIYRAAKEKGIKFVYISTDFVFDGKGSFSENSTTSPMNWYGMTKYFGEKMIDLENDLIIRLSFPYGYKSPVKLDFVQRLIAYIADNKEVSLIEDQTITPTFIDDIINGLDYLLSKDATGIFHLSGSSSETPIGIGNKIKEKFGYTTKINSSSREQVYAGKAARPFQSILINDKIKNLGFKTQTFDEGLALISNK